VIERRTYAEMTTFSRFPSSVLSRRQSWHFPLDLLCIATSATQPDKSGDAFLAICVLDSPCAVAQVFGWVRLKSERSRRSDRDSLGSV
jgi:hypothetical protein